MFNFFGVTYGTLRKNNICKMSLNNPLLAPIIKIVKCVLLLNHKVSVEILFYPGRRLAQTRNSYIFFVGTPFSTKHEDAKTS